MKQRPILLFEMTTNPQSPVSIKGEAELKSLFPEKYEFLLVSERSNPLTGAYLLEPIEGIVHFDRAEQHDLVAYPIERKNTVSLRGPIHETDGSSTANR